jgi:hypothetical protein
MQPDTGGRFSLRLLDQDASGAKFELSMATSAVSGSALAQVSADEGSVDIGGWDGIAEPPPWLMHYARAALRSAWQVHREQGWPRRLTRWRDAPSRAPVGRGDREA